MTSKIRQLQKSIIKLIFLAAPLSSFFTSFLALTTYKGKKNNNCLYELKASQSKVMN